MPSGYGLYPWAQPTNHYSHPIRVLTALSGETPKATLLRQAVRRPQWSARSLRALACSLREKGTPDVIVLPVQDQTRLLTAALICAYQGAHTDSPCARRSNIVQISGNYVRRSGCPGHSDSYNAYPQRIEAELTRRLRRGSACESAHRV